MRPNFNEDFSVTNEKLRKFYSLSKRFDINNYYRISLFDAILFLIVSLLLPIILTIVTNHINYPFNQVIIQIHMYIFEFVAPLVLACYLIYKYHRQMIDRKMMAIFLFSNFFVVINYSIQSIEFISPIAKIFILLVYWLLVLFYIFYKNNIFKVMFIKIVENSFNVILIAVISVLFIGLIFFIMLFVFRGLNNDNQDSF